MDATEADGRPLFTDPSAGRARRHFRGKRAEPVDKVTTVADAVRRLVHDGDYLAVGGFGCDRIRTAVLHEIVRQRKQDLGFAGHTATHDFQVLAAGNLTGRGRLLARVDAAYVVGLEARGLSPHARRMMESGEVEDCEWTNYGTVAAVGTGIPCAAAMLAQQTAAPNLLILFEAGRIAPLLPTMPVSVGDSRTFHRALMATSMADVMETCARGLVDYAFLGGAQIDPFGNLNSTQIGADHARPRVRLPGSGGACDLASTCWRVIVVTNHDRRRFVERLDFLTIHEYLDGLGAREAAGLPPSTGSYRVVTALAVLGYHPETCRIRALSLRPGVTADLIRARTGFALDVPNPAPVTPTPTLAELAALRGRVDPHGYVIGRAPSDIVQEG